jgi:hypothetical protein
MAHAINTTLSVDTTVYGKQYTNRSGKVIGYVVELAEPIAYAISHAGFEDTCVVRHVVVSQEPIKGLPQATLSSHTSSNTPFRTERVE